MAKRRSPAEADTRKAIATARQAVEDSRQLMLDSAEDSRQMMLGSAAAIDRSAAQLARPAGPAAVILQLGPRDYSVLAWVRDEDGEPIYRIVRQGIRAAKIAAKLAQKLQALTASERQL